MLRTTPLLAILATVSLGTVLGGCGSASSGSGGSSTIVIGEPEALTGAQASVGRAINNGAKLAEHQIADQGGLTVSGKKYRVVVKPVDYASDASQARTAVQQLITRDRAKFILGPSISLAFAPSATVLARSRAVVLSPATSLRPHLGKPGYEGMFALAGTGLEAATAEISVLKSRLPRVKRVAVLLPGDDAGTNFRRDYGTALSQAGIDIVSSTTFPASTTDYTSALTAIKAQHPDALLTGSFDAQVKPIVTEALQLGVTSRFVIAGAASEAPGREHRTTPGFSYLWEVPGPVLASSTSPQIKAFTGAYTSVLGHAPDQPLDYLSTVSHDGVMALAAAIQKAGTVRDTDKVAAALPQVRGYPNSYIGLRFTGEHTARYTTSVGIISGGAQRFVESTPGSG